MASGELTAAQTITVIVESRDLDSDERERASYQVVAPHDEAQERSRLVELVAETHPEARPRSFANGAATFLAPQHLVVAFYTDRAGSGGPAGRSVRREPFRRLTATAQDRLFDF